jgi:hypothetical protein
MNWKEVPTQFIQSGPKIGRGLGGDHSCLIAHGCRGVSSATSMATAWSVFESVHLIMLLRLLPSYQVNRLIWKHPVATGGYAGLDHVTRTKSAKRDKMESFS